MSCKKLFSMDLQHTDRDINLPIPLGSPSSSPSFELVPIDVTSTTSTEYQRDNKSPALSVSSQNETKSLEPFPSPLKFAGGFLVDPSASQSLPEVCNHASKSAPTQEDFMHNMCTANLGLQSKSDWSYCHSEQSSTSTTGDASSTRDCSTTEYEDTTKQPLSQKMTSPIALKGCRGVLCLGTSKVESIQKMVQARKAEQDRALSATPVSTSTTPTVRQVAAAANHRPSTSSFKKTGRNNKRGVITTTTPSLITIAPRYDDATTRRRAHAMGNQARINDRNQSLSSHTYQHQTLGFAGPKFKASPSPLSVPIPVFDSSD